MEQRNWTYKSRGLSPEDVEKFAAKYGISQLLSVVLLNRGLADEENLKNYLKKSLDSIYNPMLLPNMEETLKRIKKAVEEYEKITIYGDYDADGITATTILYSFLSELGANVSYYIPDRLTEGYGLNIKAINKLSKTGTSLLITVDCGIVSTGEVQLAKAQGMDVIITDHHTPQEKLPEAMVVHASLPQSEYPFKELAGVGVAFKLILGLGLKFGIKSSEVFNKYVEIAAIGTISDVVPLKDENRVIVDRGIKALKTTKNLGLISLMELAGINRELLTATSVAFGITPRINAIGRLSSAQSAVEMLLAKTSEEGYKRALELDSANRKRQAIEKDILDQALAIINSDCNFSAKKVIVLSGENWHEGVIGIVAAKICEKFYKPCIVLSKADGIAKGSARSIPAFNMFDALTACEDLLTKFGGHSQAAGLSLSQSDIDAFSQKINKYASSVLKDEDMIKTIELDCRLRPSDITMKTAESLKVLEPLGAENEKPLFSLCGIAVLSASKMGADGKHLRLVLGDTARAINAVGFGMGEYADYLNPGNLVDVAFSLDINDFRGAKSVQLMLKDIKKKTIKGGPCFG